MVQTIYMMIGHEDIPVVFGCPRYVERFTYYLAHELQIGYYFGERPSQPVTQRQEQIKNGIVEAFHHWSNQ